VHLGKQSKGTGWTGRSERLPSHAVAHNDGRGDAQGVQDRNDIIGDALYALLNVCVRRACGARGVEGYTTEAVGLYVGCYGMVIILRGT